MLKRYDEFKKQNEKMNKFSNMSNKKSKSKSKDKSDIDSDGNFDLNYSDEVNSNILKKEMPVKGLACDQTNIKDVKKTIVSKSSNTQPNDDSKFNDKKHKPSSGIVNLDDSEVNEKKKVKFVGKVAKFPNNTKASKAYKFLENVKISKSKIWYILVEKQSNELQMVRYTTKNGVNLSKFINELKKFYISKYKSDDDIISQLEKIELSGDEEGNFSTIKNIPNINIEGVKLIRRITEDLTTLLSGKLDK